MLVQLSCVLRKKNEKPVPQRASYGSTNLMSRLICLNNLRKPLYTETMTIITILHWLHQYFFIFFVFKRNQSLLDYLRFLFLQWWCLYSLSCTTISAWLVQFTFKNIYHNIKTSSIFIQVVHKIITKLMSLPYRVKLLKRALKQWQHKFNKGPATALNPDSL